MVRTITVVVTKELMMSVTFLSAYLLLTNEETEVQSNPISGQQRELWTQALCLQIRSKSNFTCQLRDPSQKGVYNLLTQKWWDVSYFEYIIEDGIGL